jgi:hypothetical protein
MDSIIPTRKIRIKQNEKKLIEDNRNPNRLEKQNIFFEDTSSDYNPNFIYFSTNDIPLFDKKEYVPSGKKNYMKWLIQIKEQIYLYHKKD